MQLPQRIGVALGLAAFLLGMLVAVAGTSWGILHWQTPQSMLLAGDVAFDRQLAGAAHVERFQQASLALVVAGLGIAGVSLCWSLRK